MAKKKAKTKLTPKQEQFCREYIIDFNATQAAIRAGYSEKTARQAATRLLSHVDIQARLAELIKKLHNKNNVKADDAFRECVRIALADVGQAFGKDGFLLDICDMPEDIRRAISGFKVKVCDEGKNEVSTITEVKFWSKDKQIENLFKHHGLFERDNEQQQNKVVNILVFGDCGGEDDDPE